MPKVTSFLLFNLIVRCVTPFWSQLVDALELVSCSQTIRLNESVILTKFIISRGLESSQKQYFGFETPRNYFVTPWECTVSGYLLSDNVLNSFYGRNYLIKVNDFILFDLLG